MDSKLLTRQRLLASGKTGGQEGVKQHATKTCRAGLKGGCALVPSTDSMPGFKSLPPCWNYLHCEVFFPPFFSPSFTLSLAHSRSLAHSLCVFLRFLVKAIVGRSYGGKGVGDWRNRLAFFFLFNSLTSEAIDFFLGKISIAHLCDDDKV